MDLRTIMCKNKNTEQEKEQNLCTFSVKSVVSYFIQTLRIFEPNEVP